MFSLFAVVNGANPYQTVLGGDHHFPLCDSLLKLQFPPPCVLGLFTSLDRLNPDSSQCDRCTDEARALEQTPQAEQHGSR